MRYVWTEGEEATLKRLAGHMSRGRIATIMGRSEQSVKAKAVKLGISLEHNRNHWTAARLAEIAKRRSAGEQWGSIAAHMGVSLVTCQKAYSRAVCAQRKRVGSQFDEAVSALGEILAAHAVGSDLSASIMGSFMARRDIFVQRVRALDIEGEDDDAES